MLVQRPVIVWATYRSHLGGICRSWSRSVAPVFRGHHLVKVFMLSTTNDPAANREEHEFKFVGDAELAKQPNGATMDRALTKTKLTRHIFIRKSRQDQLNHSVLVDGEGEIDAVCLASSVGLETYSLQVSGRRSCQRKPVFGFRATRE